MEKVENIKNLNQVTVSLYSNTLRPRQEGPCVQCCLFKGSILALVQPHSTPMAYRDHRAKGPCAPGPMQLLLKHTLGTQDPSHPAT